MMCLPGYTIPPETCNDMTWWFHMIMKHDDHDIIKQHDFLLSDLISNLVKYCYNRHSFLYNTY